MWIPCTFVKQDEHHESLTHRSRSKLDPLAWATHIKRFCRGDACLDQEEVVKEMVRDSWGGIAVRVRASEQKMKTLAIKIVMAKGMSLRGPEAGP